MDANAVLAKLADSIQGGRSFGPAFEHDGVMVVPVAYVFGGGGGGEDNRPRPAGSRPGESRPGELRPGPSTAGEAKGPSTGGGFGLVSIPIGAWVIKNGDVRWAPTFDVTLLLITAGGLVKGLSKARHRRKGLAR